MNILKPENQTQETNKQHIRTAIHLSPHATHKTIDELNEWVKDALVDAFLPQIIQVTKDDASADKAVEEVRNNPYWQEKHRHIILPDISKRFSKQYPSAHQYQSDTKTVIYCMKVKTPINFGPVSHYQTPTLLKNSSELSGKHIFFILSSEIDTPEMKNWHDISWEKIGTITNDEFQKFVKILSLRLLKILTTYESGYTVIFGEFDHPFYEDTYFPKFGERVDRKL